MSDPAKVAAATAPQLDLSSIETDVLNIIAAVENPADPTKWEPAWNAAGKMIRLGASIWTEISKIKLGAKPPTTAECCADLKAQIANIARAKQGKPLVATATSINWAALLLKLMQDFVNGLLQPTPPTPA